MISFRRTAVRTAFVIALFCLFAPHARSQDNEKETRAEALKTARAKWAKLTPKERKKILEAWQRWKRLPRKERLRREKVFQDFLRGTTLKEREDLLEKLRELKRRKDLEDLRRKQRRMHRILEHVGRELPEKVRKRLNALSEDQRMGVLGRGMARMFEVLRERFVAGLTTKEQKSLKGLRGPARFARVQRIQAAKALARLSPADRARIHQLPARQRRARIFGLVRRAHRADFAEARRQMVEEVTWLLDLSSDQLTAHLRAPWVLPVLRKLGFGDDALLARRMLRLPVARLRKALARLREISRIRDPDRRKKAEANLRDSLAK